MGASINQKSEQFLSEMTQLTEKLNIMNPQ